MKIKVNRDWYTFNLISTIMIKRTLKCTYTFVSEERGYSQSIWDHQCASRRSCGKQQTSARNAQEIPRTFEHSRGANCVVPPEKWGQFSLDSAPIYIMVGAILITRALMMRKIDFVKKCIKINQTFESKQNPNWYHKTIFE